MINYFQKQYNYYIHGILDLTGKTKIGVFQNNKHIKKIIVGNTIKRFEEYSFNECINLEEIDFTNSIIDGIPKDCFSDCVSLETIYLPENIKFIDEFAFYTSSLKSIFLNGVEKIDKFAFFFNYSLSRIEISDSIQVIHEDAFNNSLSFKIEIRCPDRFYDYFLEKFPNAKINQDYEYLIK